MNEILAKLPLWKHQIDVYQFAYHKEGALLNVSMGGGKSSVVVAIATNKNYKRVLISCPLRVVPVWKKEFEKHSPRPVDILLLDKGTIPTRVKLAQQFLDETKDSGHASIIVINHDVIWKGDFGEWSLKKWFDLTVCDESHRCKSNKSKLSLHLMKMVRKSKQRLALSGTPMPQGFYDVFAQCRFLQPGLFGMRYGPFKEKYAMMGGFNGKKIIGFKSPEAEKEFNQKLGTIMFTVKKEEAIDLPPETEVVRSFQLTPKTRAIYEDLARKFFAEIGNGTVTAANAGVKLLRLQQITSGHIRLDGEERTIEVGTEKEELLEDILEDIGQPTVVFCRFIADLAVVQRITEKLKRNYGEVSGRRSDLNADATMPASIDVLGVQIQSGGVGIDLTRAPVGIDYSMSFNYAEYTQSHARIHRPGQVNNVTFIHLVAENTVDGYISQCLQRKEDAVEKIIANVRAAQGFTL